MYVVCVSVARAQDTLLTYLPNISYINKEPFLYAKLQLYDYLISYWYVSVWLSVNARATYTNTDQ